MVVIRPETSPEDFAVTGRKCVAELEKKSGRLRMEVWNLSQIDKVGRLTFSCGTASGAPDEISVPAMGKAEVSVLWTPPEGQEVSFPLDIAGTFDGRCATKVRIPVFYRWRFLADCKTVPLSELDDPKAWRRNDSGTKWSCVWDEKEKAVRFDVAWDGSVPKWFYPVHQLRLQKESFAGARYLEFEVKTLQDKVENDFNDSEVMGLCADGKVVKLPYERPGFEWEKRRVGIPPGADFTGFRIGCLPRGNRLTYWVREFKLLK